jgi:hypothetical protein
MDHNQERRRGHFHRGGRRGPDRRGTDRRVPPPQPEQAGGRSEVDVEQIMRDIRARISQRPGLDLTAQQIQELAARRLEAVLDPRGLKPALLDELRRAAGAPAEQPSAALAIEAPPAYAEGAVYESHRGIVRLLRKLFKPLLMLMFNPSPVERALAAQARFNADISERESERHRQQAEWNALHYEIVRRLVAEVSRGSLELQSLSMRIEALAAKIDFNERRVRHMEGTMHQARPAGRQVENAAPSAAAAGGTEPALAAEASPEGGQSGEGTRRRRRRRRGRRGGGIPGEGAAAVAGAPATIETGTQTVDDEGDEGDVVDDGGPEDAPVQESREAPQVMSAVPEPEPPAPAPEAPVADTDRTDPTE